MIFTKTQFIEPITDDEKFKKAKELKRNFIGIEIAQEYANLARERIKNMPIKLL
jgi:hypothetical protein